MNQLLQMQSEGKRELLVYHYQKIQDVDEVILQLLNEAGLDGFIKSSVDKSTLVINYDNRIQKMGRYDSGEYDGRSYGICAGRFISAVGLSGRFFY